MAMIEVAPQLSAVHRYKKFPIIGKLLFFISFLSPWGRMINVLVLEILPYVFLFDRSEVAHSRELLPYNDLKSGCLAPY
jgi:hypothetical protein